MSDRMRFTEPQQRHVETVLRLVDKGVERIEHLCGHGVKHSGPAGVVSSLDPETLAKLLEMFRRLQEQAQELYRRYGLRTRKLDLVRVLDAELSSLWEMLEDCRPGQMRGYGPMEEKTAERLEADVRALLETVHRARSILLSSGAAKRS